MAAMIVLLLLPLALGSRNVKSSTELQVNQPLWQGVSPNGVANIPCNCSAKDVADLELEMRLMKTNDHQWSCSANNKTSPHCSVWKQGGGLTTFTLSHQKPDRYNMYICECIRTWPTPVIRRNGTGTILVAGIYACFAQYMMDFGNHVTRGWEGGLLDMVVKMEVHCAIFNFWTWTLIGAAGFFCLCSLCLACAYIKLRVLQSEEPDDSVTYVQMQRKRRDPENNAEYVDMREVYSVGRGSGRDMNYNSQQFHSMSYPSK